MDQAVEDLLKKKGTSGDSRREGFQEGGIPAGGDSCRGGFLEGGIPRGRGFLEGGIPRLGGGGIPIFQSCRYLLLYLQKSSFVKCNSNKPGKSLEAGGLVDGQPEAENVRLG